MAVTKKGKTAADKRVAQKDNVYENMQESQEVPMSSHLDEVVAAVSVTSKKRTPNKLPQTALFQPPREKLHLCEERAKSYSNSHEYKQAIQELVRCVALTRICYGDSHWKLAEAYINLAQGYLQLKGLSLQAKQHAEKAKEILASSIENPYHDNAAIFKCSIELFYTMGRALLALQKFKEASENLIKAEKLSKEMLQCGNIIKEEWVEIQARIKLSFAQLYQGQKRSKEALPFYQKALEYTETVRDEKSLDCVPVLRELAGVEQALGFHDAAVNHFSQAHLIVLSKNPSPEEAADSAHFIARAAVASGKQDHHANMREGHSYNHENQHEVLNKHVAEQYFQESMTHVKDSEGAGRAKFLSIQDEFCNFLQITGQKERATMILRESLEAKVGAFGDFSPEVAETYRVLGRAELAQGNHNGAYTKLKKCVQIETFLYGSQDKRTLATQQTIDTLSKISEAAPKPRQTLKAKAAFCTSVPQYTVPGKARHSVAD
ncbi:tetratricopeptide repeat protein 23 isoform X2 [Peromyscus leucopus]|uniref:tetratricopeptide repeat protein 23 isoform X2 n=1 Tax=Peromyscus leucopus TaxID=10041 RepID=UPI001885280F|nr:tetratricopeptide repeat protein 23 isoform X2 [Peromyscus leucopus]